MRFYITTLLETHGAQAKAICVPYCKPACNQHPRRHHFRLMKKGFILVSNAEDNMGFAPLLKMLC